MTLPARFEPGKTYYSTIPYSESVRISEYKILARGPHHVIVSGRRYELIVAHDGNEAFYPMGRQSFASIVKANQEVSK